MPYVGFHYFHNNQTALDDFPIYGGSPKPALLHGIINECLNGPYYARGHRFQVFGLCSRPSLLAEGSD